MHVRLTYYSRRAAPLDVRALVDSAAAANAHAGITGLLLADAEYFLQVLEGPREAVTALFTRIAADPRHDHVTLVELRDIGASAFPNWGMALFDAITKTAALWPGADGRRFDPTQMSANAINDFVRLASFELMSNTPAR